MRARRVMAIFGTRPEAIKVAPVLKLLERSRSFRPVTVVTGQHREMLAQVLDLFSIIPDHDLGILEPRQTLTAVTTRALEGLAPLMEAERPDVVLVQGDTTTTFAGALAAFYHQVPVVHLEAGLRTGNPYSPFPEEVNRRLTSELTALHLAPTLGNKANLVAENVDPARILVTGNTVVDALHQAARLSGDYGDPALDRLDDDRRRVVLVTAHRRESWGAPLTAVGSALAELARSDPDLLVVFPIHRNPAVRETILPAVAGLPNVLVVEPLSYGGFVRLMNRAHVILTDSGGIQEEGPSLAKPVLVLRDTTERPEAVAAGSVELVGTDTARIVSAVRGLLDDELAYRQMATAVNHLGADQPLLGHVPRHVRLELVVLRHQRRLDRRLQRRLADARLGRQRGRDHDVQLRRPDEGDGARGRGARRGRQHIPVGAPLRNIDVRRRESVRIYERDRPRPRFRRPALRRARSDRADSASRTRPARGHQPDRGPERNRGCGRLSLLAGNSLRLRRQPGLHRPARLLQRGTPQTVRLKGSPVASTIKYLQSHGGTLVMHGDTHQYSNVINPYTAATGDDFEFFRATENPDHTLNYIGPVAEDSTTWALGRLDDSFKQFQQSGISAPQIFEYPHYAASAPDYQAVTQRFSTRWERAIYYGGVMSGGAIDYGQAIGETFPYVVRDVYGTTVLPENLGAYAPEPFYIFAPHTVADILNAADKNIVVRDGFASFYYHPFEGVAALQQIVDGLRARGWTFASPTQVAGLTP